jgi:hypothetical protein
MENCSFLSLSVQPLKLLKVPVFLYSKTRKESEELWFAVDTGSTISSVSKISLLQLGYKDFEMNKYDTDTFTGAFRGYSCYVSHLSFCGVPFQNKKIQVWEMDRDRKKTIDGLLGMDILSHFNTQINMDALVFHVELSERTREWFEKRFK